MSELRTKWMVLATAMMLAGCMGEFEDEWASGPDPGNETKIPGDGSDPAADKTYRGNLGMALGSPVVTGSTGGLSNGYQPTCVSSTTPDASYTWTAPFTGSFAFDTMGSGVDTVIEVRRYQDRQSLGCNDDSAGTSQSEVTVPLSAGQTVIVIIDVDASAPGTYQLNITDRAIPAGGLHLWLRADAGVTASDGRVSEWRDQSGNGRHGVEATLARRPYFVADGLNGWPVLRFAGAQSLYLIDPAQPTTFTLFVVGKNNKASSFYSMILGPGSTSPNNQLRWEDGSRVLFYGDGNNMPVITTTIGDTRTFHALSARYDGASMSVYRDGNFVSSHPFTASGPWMLVSVGSWFSSHFMEGELAEVIIYDRALSESERATVNAHLRSKYGLP